MASQVSNHTKNASQVSNLYSYIHRHQHRSSDSPEVVDRPLSPLISTDRHGNAEIFFNGPLPPSLASSAAVVEEYGG
ncbi:SET domain-containing protein [Sesbania bispinosa]|nr:SET domain-containing protein [Sesbania bispinosa]